MFSVKFDGFETEEQAKKFVEWYEGQGEQDAVYWFEELGKSPWVDCRETYPLTTQDNTVYARVKMA